MSDYEIECIECGWSGRREELLCSDEDFESDKDSSQIKFNICPDCGEVDCFEDIDEEEDELP